MIKMKVVEEYGLECKNSIELENKLLELENKKKLLGHNVQIEIIM